MYCNRNDDGDGGGVVYLAEEAVTWRYHNLFELKKTQIHNFQLQYHNSFIFYIYIL